MFKYNELSDLTNGSLVTPLRLEGDKVVCKDTNGNEILCSYEDFDFKKKVEERKYIIETFATDDSTLLQSKKKPVEDNSSTSPTEEDTSTEEDNSTVEDSSYEEPKKYNYHTEDPNGNWRWIESNTEKSKVIIKYSLSNNPRKTNIFEETIS